MGTGVHLNGIITQATAFDDRDLQRGLVAADRPAPERQTAGAPRRPGNLQAERLRAAPDRYRAIELTKDCYGRYIVGQPLGPGTPMTLWNLPVVESDSITAGTFLVGAFDTAVTLIDRQEITVEISFEHAVQFSWLGSQRFWQLNVSALL